MRSTNKETVELERSLARLRSVERMIHTLIEPFFNELYNRYKTDDERFSALSEVSNMLPGLQQICDTIMNNLDILEYEKEETTP